MTLQFYKVLHLAGFASLFVALGGMTLHALVPASPAGKEGEGDEAAAPAFPRPKALAALHGLGLVLLLVAGFGAMAKLGLKAPPVWIWIKLVLWLALGGLPVLLRKKPSLAGAFLFVFPLMGALGAFLALYQPGG